MIMDDKGINDFILGSSDEELQKFSKKLDNLSASDLNLLIAKLSYKSKERLQIIDIAELDKLIHKKN
jgi:hypothetical protein